MCVGVVGRADALFLFTGADTGAMPPRVSFAITGFGPFGGVPANPTQALLEGEKEGGAPSTSSPLLAALPPALASRVRSTTILPVSAAAVRAWAWAAAENRKRADLPIQNGGENIENTAASLTVALHLGVNAESSGGGFALEAAAYNAADFRLPDVDGVCLECGPIEEGVARGSVRTSGLPVERLVRRLVEKGAARGVGCLSLPPLRLPWARPPVPLEPTPLPPAVRVSTCAGRYLCNFLYFLSLGLDDGGGRTALFVHVPPVDCVSLEDQAAFLAELMAAIVEEVEGEARSPA